MLTFRSIGITSLIVMFIFLIIHTKLNSVEKKKKSEESSSKSSKTSGKQTKKSKGKSLKQKNKSKGKCGDTGTIEEERESAASAETDLEEEDES